MLPAKKCGQKLCVVGGVFFVFVSPSKKSGCCSLAVFRSWNCLFFLFEIETLETSPFRAWKKEKEKKKVLWFAFGLATFGLFTFDLSLHL